jgi:DNA replication and repair protein RecF
LILLDLEARAYRNLATSHVKFGSGANVVLGANGAGKTSLLEAVVVLGNLRSFRTASLRRAVRHGENAFSLIGTVRIGDRDRRLEHIVQAGPPQTRSLRIDRVEVDPAQYLQYFPVFAITGHDRDLVMGGPEGRRALLDRFVFLLRPAHLEELRTYRRVLAQRNAALVHGASGEEHDAWETRLAAAAARIVVARRDGIAVLAERFLEVWRDLAEKGAADIVLAYRGDPAVDSGETPEKVEELYRQRYNETRPRDRQMGFTVDGPHRHDLSLRTRGRSVRFVLSSGQAKAAAAALRLATLAQVEKERRELFPVVVDDIDAELDSVSLVRLIGRLGSERQLFLSSTSERVAALVGSRRQCLLMENGTCVAQEAENND